MYQEGKNNIKFVWNRNHDRDREIMIFKDSLEVFF